MRIEDRDEYIDLVAQAVIDKIEERDHEMRGEYWGGFSRHNKLYRIVTDIEGELIREEFIVENHALMMYSPFLADNTGKMQ